MSEGLLVIERIIIESLSRKEKNLQNLVQDTNLVQSLVSSILPNLIMKNIICYHQGVYSIDKEHRNQWINDINSVDNIKEEVKELFISFVNQYFKQDLSKKYKRRSEINSSQETELKIQKIWLTNDEERDLKKQMVSIEIFLKKIKSQRKLKPLEEKTCEQRVVIWGISQYSDLVDGILQAV